MSAAALPMYDWPEVRVETLAFWQGIRARVPGLPELSHPVEMDDLLAIWRDRRTVMTECCWGTVDLGMCTAQQILAQRSYDGVHGGEGIYYRSALIMRQGISAQPGQRAVIPDGIQHLPWAANQPDSRSGWLGIAEDAALSAERVLWTGAHRASIRAVAEGQADIAAIDCLSWQLAQAYEPAAQGLVVVGWTAPRPGIFFTTGLDSPPDLVAALRAALLAMGQYPAEEPAHA
ncbi:PhnD/SsuA/transferrin family substrate-binding protein [Paracoccus sp. M683]|uniref:PhnD/SsuA/transferrin family substrate-binding protein n=1 Tax=Paracoccus sp. M683 TaxID=2594268 RepID=UPI00163DDAA4|nr:PhnD/SsuA/transferrin family substrate-binding protein [Paracoccus sp. M683]